MDMCSRRKLTFMVCILALWCVALAVEAQEQLADAVQAKIEVDVVRLHPPSVRHNNFRFVLNRFELEDQPLMKLIAFAYSMNPNQIVGAPKWVSEQHFDISGTTNLNTDATIPQQQQLLRQLLEERFRLKFHSENREMPAYSLQLYRGRAKLTPTSDANAQPSEWTTRRGDWERTENFRSSSIADFVLFQQMFMERPVIDHTALEGRYDFSLKFSYKDPPAGQTDSAPSMFTAMKEQLGLQFQSVKASVRSLIIDQIDGPTPN